MASSNITRKQETKDSARYKIEGATKSKIFIGATPLLKKTKALRAADAHKEKRL